MASVRVIQYAVIPEMKVVIRISISIFEVMFGIISFSARAAPVLVLEIA